MKTAERVQAVRGWAWVRALRERLDRFDESAAGRYWRHLSTADFMNSSFAFAALAVISAFPFLAVSRMWTERRVERAAALDEA